MEPKTDTPVRRGNEGPIGSISQTGIFMSGKIVEIQKHRRFRGTRSDRRQMELAQQFKRIKHLLDELEEMTDGILPLLLLRLPSGGSAGSAGAGPSGDGDPQPDIDREVLERMYRDLGIHT